MDWDCMCVITAIFPCSVLFYLRFRHSADFFLLPKLKIIIKGRLFPPLMRKQIFRRRWKPYRKASSIITSKVDKNAGTDVYYLTGFTLKGDSIDVKSIKIGVTFRTPKTREPIDSQLRIIFFITHITKNSL